MMIKPSLQNLMMFLPILIFTGGVYISGDIFVSQGLDLPSGPVQVLGVSGLERLVCGYGMGYCCGLTCQPQDSPHSAI